MRYVLAPSGGMAAVWGRGGGGFFLFFVFFFFVFFFLRACAFRRHGAVGGRGGIVIDQVFQFLARLEIRDALGGNFYAGSRLRIASHARLPLAGAEGGETL